MAINIKTNYIRGRDKVKAYDYLVYNRKTKHQWYCSAEEALLYCSKLYGLRDTYIVVCISENRPVTGIEVLTTIYHNRTEQRLRKPE